MKHNEEQQRAITHGDGPMMVLAGPGAGKTAVITNRIKNLVEQKGVREEDILVVTFSKAAAIEMQDRYLSIVKKKSSKVFFGTFHSLFFRILRAAYGYTPKDIISEGLKHRFLSEALIDSEYEVLDEKEFLLEIEKEISKIKSQGIDVDYYYSYQCPEEVFRKLYKGYQNRLLQNRALDFDDMVLYTYELFKQRQDILSRWQSRFKYILIDEFQDINTLQFENIKMLAKPLDNIFVVGDDDQSIYGFQGARPDIMLSFEKEYKKTKKVILNTNYRCSSQILKAATKLIGNNKNRFEKKLVANSGRLEDVHICKCNNTLSEADRIVRLIKQYHEEGIDFENMAVLYRTNQQMSTLAIKLMEHGIPFSMKDTLPNIFDTWMAKDIIAYLELALGSRERSKFLKICNRPVRYISRASFTEPVVDFEKLKDYYRKNESYWMLERIDEFRNQLRALRDLTPYAAINFIRTGIGYDEFVCDYAKDKGVKPEDWLETLDDILETTKEKKTIKEWLEFVYGYADMLKEKMSREDKSKQAGINLMTMHRSKGLEFMVVFIPTVNEGAIPYRKSVISGNIEDERRLLYVAMTRAKKYLQLSFVKERYGKKAEISRFVKEVKNGIDT